jgi:DNA-binding NarL/FixJ family response regulator
LYDPEPSETRWLEAVLARVAPLLDDGTGVHAFRVDLAAEAPVFDPLLRGGEEGWAEVWRRNWWSDVMLALPRETLHALVRFGAVLTTHQLFAATAARITSFAELLQRLDDEGYQHALASRRQVAGKLFYPDSLNVVGVDPSGRGVAIVANRKGLIVRSRVRHRRTLSALAAHLASAARLRRRASAASGPEAVLTTEGQLVHAEREAQAPQARELLRRAALAHRASRRAATPSEALELWHALHAGRWTLVEHFDSDGRRFLVARENTPNAPPVSALSARESQVLAQLGAGLTNKEIGYRLGLAPSTVAHHLRRVGAKLGVSSTAELVRQARARSEVRR